MTIAKEQLPKILEAALMASGQPLSIDQMLTLFLDEHQPSRDEIREALDEIATACESRGVELKQVSSGYRFQARQDYAEWISRLWEEKPPRYSRALLETLVLVAYRQPITRSEIESVRGVSVSSHIMKTLLEREWVRVVGHRDVPGKPALYATTKQFLDYFNMKSLEDLPTLQEIRDLDKINAELELDQPTAQAQSEEEAAAQVDAESAEASAAQSVVEDVVAEDVNAAGEEAVEAEEGDLADNVAMNADLDTEEEIIEVDETAIDEEMAVQDDAESVAAGEEQFAVEAAVAVDGDDVDGDIVAAAEDDESADSAGIHADADVEDETDDKAETDSIDAESVDTPAGADIRDEEEESEEMLYADSQDDSSSEDAVDAAIDASIDDKFADTSSAHDIREPDEQREAISDGAEIMNAIKT